MPSSVKFTIDHLLTRDEYLLLVTHVCRMMTGALNFYGVSGYRQSWDLSRLEYKGKPSSIQHHLD